MKNYIAAGLVGFLAISGVWAAEEVPGTEKHEEGAVELSDKQKQLVNIQIASARRGSLQNYLNLPGEFRLNMDRTANLMPKMPGFVTDVLVSEGDSVKKGQVLAKITSHKLGEYYSAYNTALEREKMTKVELGMAEKLYPQNSMSQKEYLRYKKEYADAVVERERAEIMLKSLNLDLDHTAHAKPGANKKELICTLYEIKAPFDGTVLKKEITIGENFAEDNEKAVFVLSDFSHPWLDLKADEAEIIHLSKGMPVEIQMNNSTKPYSGKVIYVAPVIDETTRTGVVRVTVTDPDRNVRPGAFATGTIQMDNKAETILVPTSAVQLVAGKTVIFVPEGDGYSPKDVKTGESANGYTQILTGLSEGEKYVSSGSFALKSVLMTSGMTGDGHGH